jgi:hypothetical protein
VAAVGQLEAKLGGDDAASAVSGVARDPDFHEYVDCGTSG